MSRSFFALEERIFPPIHRMLLPWEGYTSPITVRRHPVVMLPSALLLIADVVAFILAMLGVIPRPWPAGPALGAAIAVFALIFTWSLGCWLETGYGFLTSRVVIVTGSWRRRNVSILAGDITGADLIRTAPSRVLGYGTLRLAVVSRGARPRRVRLRFAPYPEQLYLEILGLYIRPLDEPHAGDD